MQSKVSVVIPVFQTKDYLEKCVDSVLNQTYKNIEVVLVNDGSTDGSKEVCDQYDKKYSNITVVHQRNQGVSKARNIGIKHSTGNFIMFIDSDDYIDSNMIEELMIAIIESKADIAFCNFSRVYEKHTDDVRCEVIEKAYTSEEFVDVFFELLDSDIINNIGTKIYRKEILNKQNIIFAEKFSIREDIMFCIQAIMSSKRFSFINKHFYNYTKIRDNESLMSKYKEDFFEINEELMDKVKEYLYLNNCSKMAIENYYNYYFNSIVGVLLNEAIFNSSKIHEVILKIKASNNFIEMDYFIKNSSTKKKILYFLIKYNFYRVLKSFLVLKYKY